MEQGGRAWGGVAVPGITPNVSCDLTGPVGVSQQRQECSLPIPVLSEATEGPGESEGKVGAITAQPLPPSPQLTQYLRERARLGHS